MVVGSAGIEIAQRNRCTQLVWSNKGIPQSLARLLVKIMLTNYFRSSPSAVGLSPNLPSPGSASAALFPGGPSSSTLSALVSQHRLLELSRFGLRGYDLAQHMLTQQGAVSKLLGKRLISTQIRRSLRHHRHGVSIINTICADAQQATTTKILKKRVLHARNHITMHHAWSLHLRAITNGKNVNSSAA